MRGRPVLRSLTVKRTRPKCLVGASIAVAGLLLPAYAPVEAGTSFGVNNVLQVAAGPDETQNCASLRDVLSSIDDNGSDKPYLVRLEPGKYYCGDTSLFVGGYITLEGAGKNNTGIEGTVDDSLWGVIHLGGSFSGVRSLSVRNLTETPPEEAAIGISIWRVRSSEILRGILLDEIHVGNETGWSSLAVYSSSARFEAFGSTFHQPLYADGGMIWLRYSTMGSTTSVQGSGSFTCTFCDSWVHGPLDATCQP